jgi:hypothetical protein
LLAFRFCGRKSFQFYDFMWFKDPLVKLDQEAPMAFLVPTVSLVARASQVPRVLQALLVHWDFPVPWVNKEQLGQLEKRAQQDLQDNQVCPLSTRSSNRNP